MNDSHHPAPTTPAQRPVVLETRHLTRKYGSFTALDDLSFTVREGEVFGYIGPNGAGKTTTFRILCGLLEPTSGHALVDGRDVTRDRDMIKRLVGYLPDNFGVYPNLRVTEYLDFFAAAYRIPRAKRSERIDRCLSIANAEEFRDKSMGALSRGMKQRVGIAKTLLHDPKVLILDEPAATIDPAARMMMRALLRDLAVLGKAVLVSSHILPELADVCDTVAILKSGKLIAHGAVADIMRQVSDRRVVEVHVLSRRADVAAVLKGAPGGWRALPSTGQDRSLRFETKADDAQMARSLTMLVGAGIEISGFREVEADLEEAFMALTV